MPFREAQVTFDRHNEPTDEARVEKAQLIKIAKDAINGPILNAESGQIGRVIAVREVNSYVMMTISYPT